MPQEKATIVFNTSQIINIYRSYENSCDYQIIFNILQEYKRATVNAIGSILTLENRLFLRQSAALSTATQYAIPQNSIESGKRQCLMEKEYLITRIHKKYKFKT